MPSHGDDREPGRWKRQRAWRLHYQAKGCSARKACDLACRKVTAKATWPPGNEGARP